MASAECAPACHQLLLGMTMTIHPDDTPDRVGIVAVIADPSGHSWNRLAVSFRAPGNQQLRSDAALRDAVSEAGMTTLRGKVG
jgi:hypothetical protein